MNEITSQADCGHYRCYGACGYQPPVKPQAPTADELLAEVKRQAAEIERLKASQSMTPASAAHGEIALRWRVQADGRYAVDMLVSNLDTEAQAHAAVAYVQSLFAGDEMTGRH